MLKNSLFSPLCSAPFFCFSLFLFFFSFSTAVLFLFLFLFSTLLFCSNPLFLFFLCVALYFSPQNTSFSAQTFFSFSAQKHFFQPKTFLLQPKTFFSSAQNVFFFFFPVQPLFSSSFFCFILFWFSPLFSLSAPPFFLFFSSVYPRPNVLFSCFTFLLFE